MFASIDCTNLFTLFKSGLLYEKIVPCLLVTPVSISITIHFCVSHKLYVTAKLKKLHVNREHRTKKAMKHLCVSIICLHYVCSSCIIYCAIYVGGPDKLVVIDKAEILLVQQLLVSLTSASLAQQYYVRTLNTVIHTVTFIVGGLCHFKVTSLYLSVNFSLMKSRIYLIGYLVKV